MKIKKIASYILTSFFGVRLKPETLQLPITGNCNSKCATCNVWKQKNRHNIVPQELELALQDKYLSKVKYVGLNGGEPFLHPRFIEVIKAILTLPKLEAIYIITNGIMTERIKTILQAANVLCEEKGVLINLTVSVDGVKDIYSTVRRVTAFDKVCDTIKVIAADKNKYCRTLTIGTTISRINVAYVAELKVLSEQLGVKVNYHLAVPNRRIFTADEEAYTVFHDETSKMLATEFFFGLYKYSDSWKEKLLYFQNYHFLISNGKKRVSACNYRLQDLTIDENYQIVLVGLSEKQMNAIPSNILGITRTDSAKQLAEIYTAADVFVNPSVEETFGLTSIEALACGTPVVVYQGTACEEIVGLDNAVKKGDLTAIKHKIETLVKQ